MRGQGVSSCGKAMEGIGLMDVAAESQIPVLPVETAEFSADPDPYLIAAREDHPWLARFSQGYVIHGYDEICELMADDDDLATGFAPLIQFYGVEDTMWGKFMMGNMLSLNGEAHSRIRSNVAHAFSPKHAREVRPLMQNVIAELLDDWVPKGEFDFAYFASLFPVSVMCGVLGVSTRAIVPLRQALEDQFKSLTMDMSVKPLFMAGWEVMWDFVDNLVKDREASGLSDPDALLDTLIAAKRAGNFDDTDLRFIILTLFFGGFDTSKNQLTMTMLLLLDRPEIYARCAEDLEYCGKVIRESLRHSGIASPFRQVARDFTYRDHRFLKDETLLMAPGLANRDPRVFPNPEVFDPERENAGRHVAFGRGVHICIGQYLATAQMQEGLHLIAQRIRNPRLTGEPVWRPFMGAWGPASLPIAFDVV